MCTRLIAAALAALMAGGLLAERSIAQPATQPEPADEANNGTSASVPFVVPDDVQLAGRVAYTWNEGSARWLMLDGGVRVTIGHFAFAADRLVLQVAQPDPLRKVRALTLDLENARPMPEHRGTSANAEHLLVRAATTGEIQVNADLRRSVEQAPELANGGASRVKDFLAAQDRADLPVPGGSIAVEGSRALRARRQEQIDRRQLERLPEELRRLAIAKQTDETVGPVAATRPGDSSTPGDAQIAAEIQPKPIIPVQGAAYYDVQGFAFQFGDDENTLVLLGPVHLAYQSRDSDRLVTLKAENAVVFFDAAGEAENRPNTPQQLDPGRITGIYLEDNAVISDGELTMRSPRVFYDLRYNRALLLDAVLYTFDQNTQLPLYLRAKSLRQTTADRFVGSQVQLSNSAFAQPNLAIGADRVTVQQVERRNADPGQRFSVRHATLEAEGLPFFYWPFFAGEDMDVPLRKAKVGYESRVGAVVETTWDLFGLMGEEEPEGVDADLMIDFRGEHGLGLGTDFDYERPNYLGTFDAYLMPFDGGEDEPGGRDEIEVDEDIRGFARWLHRHRLPGGFDLSLQSAYVSDETFLEEFFESRAYEDMPYETSAYLRRQEDDWAATGLLQWHANDFLPQLYELQTPGYTVDKLPELGYMITGRSLLDDRLTWFSENRLSRMQLRFGEDTAADRSFSTGQANTLFGLPNDTTSFEDFFEGAGFPDDDRLRLDTRQEITAPTRLGALDVTPFAVGRVTAYDEGFEDYAGEDDEVRLYGMVGVTLGTEFQRTVSNGRSRLLDVDGLRHIVSPSFTAAYGGTTLDSEDLPVYDFDVEPLAEGGIFRVGLNNTLQTRRGGIGRQRTVDWISLQTDLVLRTAGDIDSFNNRGEVIIPRYFTYRPELAVGGDHLYSELLWMVTDSLGVTGEITYSLETDEVVIWRVLGELDHSPRLRSYVGYTEIDALDAKLLNYGVSYRLTSKYSVSASQTLDFSESGESRTLSLAIDREFAQVNLQAFVSFDQLEDEQSFGIALIPKGLGQGLNASLFDTGGN